MEPEVSEQPVADSRSMNDRVAAAFGDPVEQTEAPETVSEAPEVSDAPPVEETFEFEAEGEKYVLPKKLEKAVMQEKDYTQKSQSLAEQRKQLDLQDQQFRLANLQMQFHKEIAPEVQQIGMLDAVLKQPVDWSKMTTDEVIRKKLELDTFKEQRHDLLQKIESKQGEWTQKQRTEFEKFKAQSLEAIKRKVPTWNEDTAKAVRAHALNEGYSEAEITSITDPRHALTLWKAHQFDQLQAKAQPTVANAKTVKTSPSNPMSAQTKEYLNYRKTIAKAPDGSPERKRAVENRIASIFSR